MGEPVSLLWAVPITAAEYDYARQQSSQALLEKYHGAPEDLVLRTGRPKFL